jgi:hypothetical protein
MDTRGSRNILPVYMYVQGLDENISLARLSRHTIHSAMVYNVKNTIIPHTIPFAMVYFIF